MVPCLVPTPPNPVRRSVLPKRRCAGGIIGWERDTGIMAEPVYRVWMQEFTAPLFS